MTQDQLEALLGRSLNPREVENLSLYLQIAQDNLDELLCISIDEVTESRVYIGREGYSTVFADIFQSVTSVKVNGDVITTDDYYVAQWDKRNATWYNSIVLDDRFRNTKTEVEIEAVWGFDPSNTPVDLQQLLAQLFAAVSAKYTARDVKSKKNEDFTITFSDLTTDEKILNDNSRTIKKYSLCNIGYVRHGDTC